jgi:hypothetical protein
MKDHESDEATLTALAEIARLLDVPYQQTRDAFGRLCLNIEMDGLQYIHELAVQRGHVEVAAEVRQMLARGERVEGPE